MMPYTEFKRTSSLHAHRHSNPIACSRYTCKPSTPPISSSSLQSRYNPCVVSGLAVVPANLFGEAIKGSDRISVIPSKDSSDKTRHQICIASIDPPPLSFFPSCFLLLLLPSHIIMYQTLIPFSLSKKTPEATPLQQSHTNIIRSLSLSQIPHFANKLTKFQLLKAVIFLVLLRKSSSRHHRLTRFIHSSSSSFLFLPH